MTSIDTSYQSPYVAARNVTEMEIVFFEFEEDFVEENVRCIPMIVRFKLDACGVKLKLSEWSKMSLDERKILSEMKCENSSDTVMYREYLQQIVYSYTGLQPADLPVQPNPAWANTHELPVILIKKLEEFTWHISLQQWRRLTDLQRFALLKLCRPGHENKNFPKAMAEFGLI